MKQLAYISRDSGETAGSPPPPPPPPHFCHGAVASSSHITTHFLRAETSRQHAVQTSHRAGTPSVTVHGSLRHFLHTETFLRHHAVQAFSVHPPCGNFVSTHRNFISPRGRSFPREIIFTRRKIIRRHRFGAKTGQKRPKPRVLPFQPQPIEHRNNHERKLRSRK